jgi:signal transduction histidine kinase
MFLVRGVRVLTGAVARAGRSTTSFWRWLSEDLFNLDVQVLPPLTRLGGGRFKWLPHLAIAVYAFILGGVNLHFLVAERSLSGEVAIGLALVQSTPVLLAMYRPMAAWWLSLAGTITVALLTLDFTASPGDVWPWTPLGLQTHLLVLILVALRVRVRAMAGLWLLTVVTGMALVSYGYEGTIVAAGSNLPVMSILSGTALVVIAAVRGRSEAMELLAEQAHMTSAERSRRTLLEERARIARELHDVVAHHMSVIAIQAEAAPYRVTNPPEELRASFATIRRNAVDALSELRRVLDLLRAEEGDREVSGRDEPQPTLGGLDDIVANVRDAGLSVETAVTGGARALPSGVELSAYRIVQEALSNALRHAPDSEVRVEISYVLGGVGLRITNGASSNSLVKTATGTGHGLLGMRERVAMLGGEFRAGPTDDGGYEVVAFLPVTQSEDE